jgi:hypothetical protein
MTRKQKKHKIKAAAKSNKMFYATADIQFIEAAAGEESALPTFRINAYNGGMMSVGYYGNIVVNLAGMKLPKGPMPVLQHHDTSRIVGHGTPVISGSSLNVEGVISGSSDASREVTESGKNGFPWQASLGATPVRIIELSEGDSKEVNGQKVVGPVSIIDKSVLNETSFVPLGADGSTSAEVSAEFSNGGTDMKFAKWVEAKGFNVDDLSESQTKSLKAMYDAEIAAAEDDGTTEVVPAPEKPAEESAESKAITKLQAKLEAMDTEKKINALFGGDNAELRAEVIAKNMTVEQAQAALIAKLQSEGAGVRIEMGMEDQTKRIDALSAHLMVRCGGETNHDMTAEQTALGQSMRKTRLVDVAEFALKTEGRAVPMNESSMVRAAFSTAIMPNIINNVATKAAMKGFNSIESTSMQLCNITSPTDYKVNERVRLDDNVSLSAVEYGNEVTHGDISDTKESYKIVRYAKKVTLEEMDIVNDNLDLLSVIPRKLGGRAKALIDQLVYGIMTDNAAMSDAVALYHANHANLQTGSALTIATVGVAMTAMMKQTNKAGDYIEMDPKYVIVPTTLWDTAVRILSSDRTVAALTTPLGEKNPVAGALIPVVSRQLEASSSSTWYVSANPAINDTIELGFLNGVQTPTIETEREGLNVFGFTTRVRFDLNAKALDWRGVNKNTA